MERASPVGAEASRLRRTRWPTTRDYDDLHWIHRTDRNRAIDCARSRGEDLVPNRQHSLACQGVAVSSNDRLFDGVHRLLEPFDVCDGRGTGVECPAVTD